MRPGDPNLEMLGVLTTTNWRKRYPAIDRLKKYRAAAVTVTVTGKIDVRHFQAPQGESHAPAALS